MRIIMVLLFIGMVVLSLTTYFQNKFDTTVLQWMQDQLEQGDKNNGTVDN